MNIYGTPNDLVEIRTDGTTLDGARCAGADGSKSAGGLTPKTKHCPYCRGTGYQKFPGYSMREVCRCGGKITRPARSNTSDSATARSDVAL